MRYFKKSFKPKKEFILLFLLFLLHLFLRTYNLEQINPFGWDQVDNAWAAKNILVNHAYPLIGMQAKLNSGIFIGSLYYYLVALFYFFTSLDPIASVLVATGTSIITFFTVFWVTRKIFSYNVAIVAVFIYTISSYAIFFDRIQWPVNFITSISLLVFFSIYNVVIGKPRFLILLGIIVGLAFHIHFTAIFYVIIVFLTLPFFPRNRKTIKYSLYGLVFFLLLMSPLFVYKMQSHAADSLQGYLQTNYHGIHLKRILQLSGDAIIKFDSVLRFEFFRIAKFFLIPLFIILYLCRNNNKKGVKLSYLLLLWFIVPWFVFATYKGELSDYYFTQTLPFVYIILSYISIWIFEVKNIIAKVAIIGFWLYFTYYNLAMVLPYKDEGSLANKRQVANDKIIKGEIVKFQEGVSDSYLYYLYLRKTNNKKAIELYFK